MAKTRNAGTHLDWLEFVPPGGLWMLGGLVTLLLALAAKQFHQTALQLILVAGGLIAAGVGVLRRLRENGIATGTLLTGGVLTRLLLLLGAIVLLMIAGVFLVNTREEYNNALTAFTPAPQEVGPPPGQMPGGIVPEIDSKTFTWTAPGGGLPDGHPKPFPWMFFTAGVCLFLGLALVAAVGIGLLLKWGLYTQYVAEEPGPAEVQLSSALMLVLGAVAALLAYLALDPVWDSGRMFLCVTVLVALVGAMLIVLPLVWRKVLVSLLIVLHFGGIATAITAIAPPNAPAPWLASKLWLVFYRPYLQFTYMNNAYHFYSPEPGPATLIWAHLVYEGGGFKEIQLPSRTHSPVPMYYQRMLSITESISQTHLYQGDMQAKIEARHKAIGELGIPMHPEIPDVYQFGVPSEQALPLLAAYARHLARMFPTLDGKKIEYIKMYRVTHNLIDKNLLARGRRANDLRQYLPFYYGAYSPEGKLLDPDDSLLYWLIPMVSDPNHAPDGVINFQALHARLPVRGQGNPR